jgi:hypothetical protein
VISNHRQVTSDMLDAGDSLFSTELYRHASVEAAAPRPLYRHVSTAITINKIE